MALRLSRYETVLLSTSSSLCKFYIDGDDYIHRDATEHNALLFFSTELESHQSILTSIDKCLRHTIKKNSNYHSRFKKQPQINYGKDMYNYENSMHLFNNHSHVV